MNREEKDRLKSLFQEMKLDEPSANFENELIKRIHAVAEKKSRKQNIISIVSIATGIIGMIGIPAIIFRQLGFPLKAEIQSITTSLTFSIPVIDFNPFVVSIACVGVLLFIGDTLIRRRIWHKRYKH